MDNPIDLEKLVRSWGAADWEDFVKTIRSGWYYAIDAKTGKTVKVPKVENVTHV